MYSIVRRTLVTGIPFFRVFEIFDVLLQSVVHFMKFLQFLSLFDDDVIQLLHIVLQVCEQGFEFNNSLEQTINFWSRHQGELFSVRRDLKVQGFGEVSGVWSRYSSKNRHVTSRASAGKSCSLTG